ncbi:MAG: hypothetical protein HY076_00345 [Candidatus Eisenbacteria bacterium]|uniref:Uncharacterized protein n=1 Tax=Eiseniibacteriota bacterium TaxID=2212470 RepID=A0A9D6L6V0_UNCEI|nr:hypothetical protein [Candidatus Eisenbacteria bacterium]
MSRHHRVARARRELAFHAARIAVQQGGEIARDAARVGHLARRRGDRVGHQVVTQHAAVAVEQVAAHRLHQLALFLVTLGAFLVVTVLHQLEPSHAQPQREQAQRKTGRSHQHPTPAHIRVGQCIPPWNGGSRRPPGRHLRGAVVRPVTSFRPSTLD